MSDLYQHSMSMTLVGVLSKNETPVCARAAGREGGAEVAAEYGRTEPGTAEAGERETDAVVGAAAGGGAAPSPATLCGHVRLQQDDRGKISKPVYFLPNPLSMALYAEVWRHVGDGFTGGEARPTVMDGCAPGCSRQPKEAKVCDVLTVTRVRG